MIRLAVAESADPLTGGPFGHPGASMKCSPVLLGASRSALFGEPKDPNGSADLLQYWLNGTCDPAKCYLIFRFDHHRYSHQCACIQLWAEHARLEGSDTIERYCQAALPDHGPSCLTFFERLAGLGREAAASDCDMAQGVR
ncbi:unnamed protein product [Prorocentrum cordatum]|uniref:Sulfhydryl oxidase n=1 Tax=Prorocentrum cordatum TaxID=2364126 RepID=A0ABN9RSI8_9DINO|nr:unnamed protein product [Polarella glacialis]